MLARGSELAILMIVPPGRDTAGTAPTVGVTVTGVAGAEAAGLATGVVTAVGLGDPGAAAGELLGAGTGAVAIDG